MKFSFLSAAAVVLIAMPAFALDLHTARGQGQVGEKLDGYVAVVTPGADVSALVNDVNAKRRAEYTRISKENGQTVDVVGKLAAPQIMQGLPAGSLVQDASGAWKKR